ncbi:MAG: bifunctional pyr operon transcriptional regulator/uracil phosphoribosyltransferase PyrR [Thermodesulfobacteriota bacterium]|nr:bifunctional pyr operon transcriptional regulator/uracil phosphoribosyltransferase PyrR [Thermodesulfobacteriota bacterium]
MKLKEKETVMTGEEIERALARLTHEMLERNKGVEDLVLIGIRTGGVYLAERIRAKIEQIEKVRIPFGIIDITLYRDDFTAGLPRPLVGKTEIPFSLKEKRVILVDDVLYTGRTVRAAMDALIDFGRPKFIQLAVLIDRGCRELPIQADYVGKKTVTAPQDEVAVSFREAGDQDRVVIQEKIP